MSGENNNLKIWDIEQGKEIMNLKGHASSVNSVCISPDGKILASGSIDETIKLWNIISKKEISTLKGHTRLVNSVKFSPSG